MSEWKTQGAGAAGKPSKTLEAAVTGLAMIGAFGVMLWGLYKGALNPNVYAGTALGVMVLGIGVLVWARRQRGCKYKVPVACVCACVVLALLLVPVWMAQHVLWGLDMSVSEKSHQLFYSTDHAQLLAACREVMAHPELYGTMGGRFRHEAHEKAVPKIITDLKPDPWTANKKCMYIQLTGRPKIIGVMALAEGVADNDEEVSGFGCTLRIELVPGLWFTEGWKTRTTRYPPGKEYRERHAGGN